MNSSNNTQQLTSFNVLLIGDSCTDEYKIGTVDRLSPEAPVPIIKLTNEYSLPGMSANVLRNLQNLDINPDFVTNDSEIKKTRYIDQKSGQHLLRVDTEPAVVPWDGKTPNHIKSYDAILISDYNKGFLTYESVEQVIRSANCPIFIDTKKQDLSRFSAAWTYIKINESEYKNRYSIPKHLIVTLGDKGAQFNGKMYSTTQVEVMDVCGCGDTFMSALAAQYLFTKDIEAAIIFANVAAGITVQHRGNYAPTLDEIRNAGY